MNKFSFVQVLTYCHCFKENIRDQIARGIHISQIRKKQSLSSFVEDHKAKNKNLT